jgi:DnaK suppressor protein
MSAEKLDFPRFRELLLKRRQELLSEDQISAERAAELDQKQLGRLSRMDALQSEAVSAEARRRRELELRRVDQAIRRMDSGEYGYCVTCGEQISVKRLETDPAAPLCIRCASAAEAAGRGGE